LLAGYDIRGLAGRLLPAANEGPRTGAVTHCRGAGACRLPAGGSRAHWTAAGARGRYRREREQAWEARLSGGPYPTPAPSPSAASGGAGWSALDPLSPPPEPLGSCADAPAQGAGWRGGASEEGAGAPSLRLPVLSLLTVCLLPWTPRSATLIRISDRRTAAGNHRFLAPYSNPTELYTLVREQLATPIKGPGLPMLLAALHQGGQLGQLLVVPSQGFKSHNSLSARGPQSGPGCAS